MELVPYIQIFNSMFFGTKAKKSGVLRVDLMVTILSNI